MFVNKKLICLALLITFCGVNGQLEEVAVWEVVKAVGQGIYYLFRGISEGKSFIENANAPPELNNASYRYISLKNSIQQIQDKIEHFPDEISDLDLIKNLIVKVKEKTIEIDNIYEQYILYLSHNESDYNKLKFAEDIINVDVGVTQKILEIHSNFVGENYNLALLIEKHIEVLDPFCSSQQTRQQYFYDLFISILSHEFKAYALLDYAYKIRTTVKGVDQEADKGLMRKRFSDRIEKTVSLFDEILKRSSRDFWKCDAKKPIKGKTYEELNLFRRIFYHETDFYEEGAYCQYDCKAPNASPSCHDRNDCNPQRQRRCSKVVACGNIFYLDAYVVCLPHKQDSGPRYSSVVKTAASYIFERLAEKEHPCDGGTYEYVSKFYKWKYIMPLRCTACDCICDEDDDADRYVSMKMATSDVRKNYVVTGAKIVLKKHTIYLQIQEGKLIQGGFIDDSTVRWKDYNAEPDDFTEKRERTKNYTAISYNGVKNFDIKWESRGINFNPMSLPKDEVVTGLRFIFDTSNYLILDIRSTPIDLKSGNLFYEKSYWYTTRNPDPKREVLNLEKAAVPSLTGQKNKPNATSQLHYAHFGPSGIEVNDYGQSTIPFIDIQAVAPSPAMPLSGISLDLKREENTGGFIMLRLNTYDVNWFKN